MKQLMQYRKAAKGKNKIYWAGRIAGLKGRKRARRASIIKRIVAAGTFFD